MSRLENAQALDCAMRRPPEDSLTSLVSLSGRRALITGAAAGIGRATALRLAEAGADLDLVDIDVDTLSGVAAELSGFGVEIALHHTDIARKSAIDELWAALPGPPPDILVNNAGIYPGRAFVDVDEAFYRKQLATNLDSVVWMCQAMIRRRIDRGGVIVNLGSIEAILPFKEDLASYGVAKAGVIALTRALAREHGKHGFRINALLPGGVVTAGTRTVAREILRGNIGLVRTGIEFRQRLPIGRLGHPDEIARMILVLAGDLASYVHGAVIAVDGGFLAS